MATTIIDNEQWTVWGGGKRAPLPDAEVQYFVAIRDGEISTVSSSFWRWEHLPGDDRSRDIIAYRVAEKESRDE